MTNLHFKFSGLSLGSRLCIQSSTSKSRQNRFATKNTGESVSNNLIKVSSQSRKFEFTVFSIIHLRSGGTVS